MERFIVDPAHTDIGFSVKYMMLTTVRGAFTEVSGTIDIDEADPSASRANVVVKTASIDTGSKQRDNHLRSADFFNVEAYPEMSASLVDLRPVDGKRFSARADVTILDVTKPVDFDIEFLGFGDGMDKVRRAGFSARAVINRKDWGLGWNVALEAGGLLVGDTVTIEMSLLAVEAVAVPA
jgi:polyisoprenoid-binding protein YceI